MSNTDLATRDTDMGAFDQNDVQLIRYLGLDPSRPQDRAVVAVCRHYNFDPLLKHVIVIPKGGAEALKAGPLAPFLEQVGRTAPHLRPRLSDVASWDDVKLLSVAVDRLEHWSRPGLLCIGDAAHAMSPIGGVGINLAIQDAVAAANMLAAPLVHGTDVDALLDRVQRRRMFPTRVIQAGQKAAQDNLIGRLLDEAGPPITQAPLIVRLLDRRPLLRRLPGRIIGLGVRREHVRSPDAFPA